MFVCPHCKDRLIRTKTGQGLLFVCRACHGRAANVGVLRKAVGIQYVNQLWRRAKHERSRTGRGCPACRRPMREVPVTLQEDAVSLDVCTGCHFAWFDPQEFEQLRAAPQTQESEEKPRKELPEKVRVEMARFALQSDTRRQSQDQFGSEWPDEAWKWVPGFLGMPVEHEVHPVRTLPWLTWALVLVTTLVFVLTFANLGEIIAQYGLIPAEAGRLGGLTFLTSFFLHASLFHLVANMYFLLVFGDNVEDYLGRWRYLALLAGAALLGDVIHLAAEPRADIPMVGASGGISGVIAFYALQFPHARLGFMFRIFLFFRWVSFPAWLGLPAWVLLQLVGVFLQVYGASNVSALAHLGGAAVGVAAWAIWRDRQPEISAA
jgi:membrane associated rhomboid family serine protease